MWTPFTIKTARSFEQSDTTYSATHCDVSQKTRTIKQAAVEISHNEFFKFSPHLRVLSDVESSEGVWSVVPSAWGRQRIEEQEMLFLRDVMLMFTATLLVKQNGSCLSHKQNTSFNCTRIYNHLLGPPPYGRSRILEFISQLHSARREVITALSGRISARMGAAVAQFVEALRYKPEGRGFCSGWWRWNFSLT
jgi:hypothetical protein